MKSWGMQTSFFCMVDIAPMVVHYIVTLLVLDLPFKSMLDMVQYIQRLAKEAGKHEWNSSLSKPIECLKTGRSCSQTPFSYSSFAHQHHHNFTSTIATTVQQPPLPPLLFSLAHSLSIYLFCCLTLNLLATWLSHSTTTLQAFQLVVAASQAASRPVITVRHLLYHFLL
jgi:hypothetical protein